MMMVDRDEGSTLIFNVGDECDDVYIDIEDFWESVESSDQQGPPEDTGVENMPPVEDKQGMPTSTEVFSADNQLPEFDVPYLPNNYEASDLTRGYSNGLPESPWNYSAPNRDMPEASSQTQGNDFYYTHVNGHPQNTSSSFQNSSMRIPTSLIQSDLHVKKLKEETNVGPSFSQMDGASTLDGDKIYHDTSNTESSSGDFAGADMSDMLSENGDLYFLPEDHSNYYQTSSGYDQFMYDDFIIHNSFPPLPSMNLLPRVKDERKEKDFESKRTPSFLPGESPTKKTFVASDSYPMLHAPEKKGTVAPSSTKPETNSVKMETDSLRMSYYHPKVTPIVVQNGTCVQNIVDDDSDLCILEDKSTPARASYNAMSANCGIAPHFAPSRISGSQITAVPSRFKPNDERTIFQVAVQDLSQPKSETTPPDGLLSVSLLKHQRIALSWMVHKETRSGCCSGGILADDQGLGKTISTIALILKERSPSSKSPKTTERHTKTETLNLDEDDDGAMEALSITNGADPCPINGFPINGGKASLEAKGRPSGGTLIICPTSVLRQWAEELDNKVTSSADLSVLVYYGSSRTKDPIELAQYDVVITTYAIVSMEVPKQPVVGENEDQMGSTFKDFSSNKKRKLHETTDKKSKKSKKGIDSELLESTAGPLAKVGWFRVVLDEAQSIKNHRTQVARACWGLRAKRRWCLSGTPIQNAIDDLYSYFRFLRHEPYAVFKTFIEQIKVPVHRNPKTGYKKLQAVLKTIMLRRTKGTRIDGEPIINLPPKTVELKKIDFSPEERDFYCRLEADSRAQFAEYAAAGTVKQNYVNILLMLLRLRQACDHPLLVKGFNSNLKLTSSIEMAKKLPRPKQLNLLNCLEASLAICGICNDPPEDAVVTDCGHVFCNQCICEHMIGDDSQCPSKKCKKHLNRSLVFSTTALRTALSEQPSMGSPTKPEPLADTNSSEPHSLMSAQDSSKIKAALDLLLSLCKPQDCIMTDVTNGSEMLQHCAPGEENVSGNVNRESKNPVKGQKAIVFSQWTGMLDLLETCLKTSSIQYRRLDGTMPVSARDRAVKDFNTLPQVTVMIMSLKAASLGLNMVAACNVILLDLWWNPTTEDQAVDRAHRIGQVRPVSVFRLTVKETVEDRILALQQRKREMVASAFGEDESGSRQTRLTVEDLKYLFKV